MPPTARSIELRATAQAIADGFPSSVEEVALTGSVSRGIADRVSDIEMLVVTVGDLSLEDCFALASSCGLTALATWGAQGLPTKRVFGYRDGVPVELIWWSRAHAESAIDEIFEDDSSSRADAIVNGLPLRTAGLLARWQARLHDYPDELAARRIEDAALTWGGYAPAALLTVVRPGERLALVERMLDDASRVVRIVFALNRVWQPTHKRLWARAESLALKPERFVERIEEALTEPDPRRALLVLTGLQLDTVELAPDGPNVIRARRWLHDVREALGASSR